MKKIVFISVTLFLTFSLIFSEQVEASQEYDVVVVGAGTGGVSAAIQAARMGAKVALLEETDWVGGQAIAVPNMDEGGNGLDYIRQSGIYSEFTGRIRNYYNLRGKSVGTCYWTDSTICFEPSVGQQILLSMLQENNLDLYLRTKVSGVLRSSNLVTGVVTENGGRFNSKVVIDATEYGDVIALTPARYRVGNSESGNINADSCVQDITYTAIIKKYPGGVPDELFMNNPPPGYSEAKLEFEKVISPTGFSWWSDPGVYPQNWLSHSAYRGVPDSSNPNDYTGLESDVDKISKTGVNWANDYPSGASQAGSSTLKVSYIEDENFRKQANCEAKLETLQFIYYVQNELGHPDWSIANDEGFDTDYNIQENSCLNIPSEFKEIEKHFPPLPYVREGKRIIALHTLTGKEIKRVGSPAKAQTSFKTALAVGNYANDLHNCNQDNTLETAFESSADITGSGLFQVPFESFIPETMDGFLVAEKNIGVTRLVNGATRLQPITIATGQAAGAIAAYAVQQNIQPRQVKPIFVQKELLDSKSILSLYNFSDVPQSHPFWTHVQLASLYGIMIGYNDDIFGVDDIMLRRYLAVVLVKAFDIPSDNPPSEATFVDVPKDHPQFKEIEAIYKEGITAGCSADPLKFCPDNKITRAEIAVFLVRALKLDPNEAPTEQIFEDVGPTHWAFPYVQLLYEKGITSGCSETPRRFCPNDLVTRGQAAAFVMNTFIFKESSLPTPTPTPKPGDANGDGKVDGLDYIIWLNHYNQTTSNGPSDGDFNGDGKVDGLDYVIWLNNYEI